MAARYWVGTGTNWNSTSSWSATDGGSSGASVPLAADDVYFTSLSVGNAVITASSVCNNLDCTGYSGTWSSTGSLNISGGTVIMSSTMSSTWTGTLTLLNTTVSVTSNGFLWNTLLISTAAQTTTLVGNMSVTTFTHSSTGTTTTINGDNLIWRGTGQFSMSSGRILTGTSLLVIAPTTSASISVTGRIDVNVSINAVGTINQIGAVTIGGGSTWTYTSGTWTYGTSQLVASGNCTLNLAGMPIYGLTVNGTGITVTLTSLLTCINNVTQTVTASFAGTHGFITPSLNLGTNGINGRALTLKAGITYTVTSLLSALSIGYSSRCTIQSDSVGNRAFLIMPIGSNAYPAFVDVIDIDSSGGRLCKTFMGVISNTINWISTTSDVNSIGSTF